MNEAITPPAGGEPLPPLTWRDFARPLLALALGVLYFECFGLDRLFEGALVPGVGVTAFVWAFFGAVLLSLGRRARYTRPAVLFMAAALLLSLSCALWSDPTFALLNCFVILGASAAAVFLLSGQAVRPWWDVLLVPECFLLFFQALFSRIPAPFRTFRRLRGEKKGVLGGVLLGLVIAVPLLAAVIALLSGADAVFGGLFSSLADRLWELDAASVLWHILRALAAAVLFCSGLVFIGGDAAPAQAAAREPRAVRNVSALIPALLLDAVYILFCAIQLRYLFGGREAAAMSGGWAEYARTGFFQLVAVAAVNLCFCGVCSEKRRFAAKGGLALRLANAVMLACTAVILASAFWRMRLYITVFGLSVLRLLTLWGMLVILVCILAAAAKLKNPSLRLWGVFLAFALSSWCVLSLAGPDRIIADYNVDGWLSGRITAQEVDDDYLSQLSPDVLPALERLRDAVGGDEELDGHIAYLQKLAAGETDDEPGARLTWTQWRLSLVPYR